MSEFPSHWTNCQLGERIRFEYGKSPNEVRCSDGKYPVYGSSGKTALAIHYTTESPAIIVGRKGTIDKPIFLQERCWAIDTTFFTDKFPSDDPKYLFYLLGSINLSSLNESTGVPSLSRDALHSIPISIPPLSEQKKIAEILSGIDRVINGYTKHLNHRKLLRGAFLDKEISVSKGTKNLVPIGEVAIQSKKKGIGELPIYSVSVENGMIRRDSLERSIISSLDQKDNLYATKGDFCYNMMRMWQGASGIAPEDCLVSPAYVVCRPTNIMLPEYLAIACRSKELIGKFRSSSRGITSDRWRLYYEDFAKIEIPLPDKTEQSAIVARNKLFLSSIYKSREYLHKAIRLKESISSDLLSGRKRVSI